MVTRLKDVLPHVYQHFLHKSILNRDVTETKATCENCLRSRDHRFPYLYKPDLKCCTFQPFLPNYAIGGILKNNLKGAAVIRKQIVQKNFSLPLGVFPVPEYQYRFQNKKKTDFGNRVDLLCPYFDLEFKKCSIWEFRCVVCTTFYCRSDKGKSGQQFWSNLNDYLSYLEMALAEECLVQKDFSPRDISDQLKYLNMSSWEKNEKKQRVLDAKDWKIFWNGYSSPEEFYVACYNYVENLQLKDVKAILGLQGESLTSRLQG